MANTTIKLSTTQQSNNQTISGFAIGDTITLDAENQGATWNVVQSNNVHTSGLGQYTTTGTGQPNQFYVVGSTGGAVPNGGTGAAYVTVSTTLNVYKDPNGSNALWLVVTIPNTATTPSATIDFASTATVAEGSTVTLNYDGNLGNASFNSTGSGGVTDRFNPKSGNRTLAADGDGSFNATCNSVDLNTSNADGSWTGGYSIRSGGPGGTTLDTTQAGGVRIYKPVALGTISIAESSRNDADGSFILQGSVSGAETINGFYPIEYRFRIDNAADAALCTTRGVSAPGTVVQAFSSTSTCSLGGSYRGIPIEVQHRIVGNYNNTGGSAYTSPITIPIIAEDGVVGLTGDTIAWDATTFDVTITGAQVGDEVQVTNSGATIVFEDWTTITNATSQTITCNNSTINSTNLPYGQTTQCRVRIRRQITAGGDEGVTPVFFDVTRNYRAGPFGSVAVTTPAVADRTIGAQQYFGYDVGQSEQVRITGSGVISGATYIARIQSGTTEGGATSGIVYNQTASGTEPNAATTAGGLDVNQLPPVNASVTYRVFCIVPTSLGGDGTTEHRCTTLTIPLPTSNLDFTMTRSNYVQPNLVTGPFSIPGVFSTGSTNNYVLGFTDTADKSWTVSSTQTGQVYKVVEGGTDYDTFGTGNSSLSGTFLNSDIPVSDGLSYAQFFLETAVPVTSDGTGLYSNCTESGGSPLVFAFLYREVAYTTPTINAISARMETSDLSKIVPYVQLTDPAGNTAAEIDFVWSTTTPNPTTGWFNPSGSLSMTGYHSANFSLDKFSAGSTPANYTVYYGVRARSPATGATTTANYTSYSVVGANYVLDPGGGLADGYLNQENNPSEADFIEFNSEIVLESTDTLDETVSFSSLSNPAAIDTVAQSDYRNSTTSALFTSVSPRTQYFINVISGSVQGGGTQVGVALLPLGDTSDTYTLSNPSELPTTGNSATYKFYRRQLQNQGGDGTSQVPAQDQTVAQWTARRRIEPDGDITVTVPKTQLTSADGNQTITIADGNSNTQYRIRVTATTDGGAPGGVPTVGTNVGDRVDNGTIILDSNDLPGEGDTVSYKVQFREQSTSDIYQDCTGTNVTFTIARTGSFELGGPFTVPISSGYTQSNEAIVEGFTGTLDIALSGANTQFRVKPSGGSYGSWTNSGVTGQTISSGGTIQVRNDAASTYSTNTTANLTLDQGATTLFSDSFTITTEADPGGSSGGGGGTGGTYGLRVFDSSGNTVLDINDAVTNHASFNGPLSVTVTTGNTVGTANLPTGQQGNVALILDSMNPAILQDCAEVSVSGNQVTVTTLAQRTTNKTFSVLVLDS